MWRKKTPAELAGVTEDHVFLRSDTDLWCSIVAELPHRFQCNDDSCEAAVIRVTNVGPRLQAGPSCGLVALRMAAHALAPSRCPTSRALLDAARGAGYTVQGELFHAHHAALLARDCLGLEASRAVPLRCPADVVRALWCGSGLAMMAYDAAPNHDPGMYNGKRAHWALVCGLLVPKALAVSAGLPLTAIPACDGSDAVCTAVPPMTEQQVAQVIRQARVWEQCNGGDDESSVDGSRDARDDAEGACVQEEATGDGADVREGDWMGHGVWLICQQSKSKRAFVWPLEQLWRSNGQLRAPHEGKVEQGLRMRGDDGDDPLAQLRRVLVMLETST